MRDEIEAAAQASLDTADHLIALLDRMDGDPDLEPSGDDKPSLGAPENHDSHITWLRGTTRDLELATGGEFVKARLTMRAALTLALGLPCAARQIGRARRFCRELLIRAGHEAGRGNVLTATVLVGLYLAGV